MALPRIVLASASPRRSELLSALGLTFTVAPAGVDETPLEGEDPKDLALRLARSKALAVAAENEGALVIAADTVVALDGRSLDKPADEEENCSFARQLSGRTHDVFTGHALVLWGRVRSEVVRTGVTFRQLSESEIQWYGGTGEGLDKAGGYALQGKGAALIESVEGCWSNVIGLSLPALFRVARQFGVEFI